MAYELLYHLEVMKPRLHHKQRFDISFDFRTKVLTINLWGLWDAKEAETFKEALWKEVKTLGKKEEEWHILMDLTAYPSQLEEVQHIINEGVSFLNTPRIAILAHRPTDQFQNGVVIQGIERQIYSYFSSQKDAVHWLLN